MTDFTTSIFHNNKEPAFGVCALSGCAREHIGEWCLGGRPEYRSNVGYSMVLGYYYELHYMQHNHAGV